MGRVAFVLVLLCVLPCIFVEAVYRDGVKQKEAEGTDDVFFFISETILNNPVVIFSKSYCPYCKRAKAYLTEKNIEFFAVEMDLASNGREIQQALKEKTGQRTVPNIFIGGQHIGGYDSISQLPVADLTKRVAEA